jgi:protein-tyrosine-phosphatase
MAEGYLSATRKDLAVKSCGLCHGGEKVSENSRIVMAEIDIDIKDHISTEVNL